MCSFTTMTGSDQSLDGKVIKVNYRIEDHHVQFKVDPNPQEVDAKTVVDHFISNKELQKRISSELGIDVANALSGSEVSDLLQYYEFAPVKLSFRRRMITYTYHPQEGCQLKP